MDTTQKLILFAVVIIVFTIMGYSMKRTLNKYEENKKNIKKKKGKTKYLQQVKNPGK